MTQGHNAAERRKNAKRFGRIPNHLIEPKVRGDVSWVMGLFAKLKGCNGHGPSGVPNPIPFSEVRSYGTWCGWSRHKIDDVWIMITAMDDVYREEYAKRMHGG